VHSRSRFSITLAIACLAACGGTPREPIAKPVVAPVVAPDAGGHLQDPDLNHALPKKLLAIDWDKDVDPLAVWQQIAPTGADWEAKLEEIPADHPIAHKLALALLREGNFTCAKPPSPADCGRPAIDVDPPADTATLADPCLRRMLALWSIAQLEDDDIPQIKDALRAIVAIPPPESQLVSAALKAVPENDVATRMELIEIAWKAGQHDIVNGALSGLDVPQLIDAASKLHVDGALEILSAEANRDVYLHAVTDELMTPTARAQAIVDLVATDPDKLAPDVKAALVAAMKSPSCPVVAAAARALDQHGEHKYLPRRPHTSKPDAMVRGICVLASYEQLQKSDEASLLPTFLPAKGLELAKVVYDPYNETDADGDGDPHTVRSIDLVPRDQAVLPEIEELTRALHNCKGTICRSAEHEFRFTFKALGGELVLSRLEVVDRPPCH
jgi:hypothetical protein